MQSTSWILLLTCGPKCHSDCLWDPGFLKWDSPLELTAFHHQPQSSTDSSSFTICHLGDKFQAILLSSSNYFIAQEWFIERTWAGEREKWKRFSLFPPSPESQFHFMKDQEGPCMPICTIESIMKKSVTSSVTVRECKWIPQRNNWKQSDSLSAQLGEKQCSYLRKKRIKNQLKFAFFRTINPFEWREPTFQLQIGRSSESPQQMLCPSKL